MRMAVKVFYFRPFQPRSTSLTAFKEDVGVMELVLKERQGNENYRLKETRDEEIADRDGRK